MNKYFYIGLGGFLGAICRHLVSIIPWNTWNGLYINTIVENITGSFMLCLFLTATLEIINIDEHKRLGISTGFFGSYTTFSTFCKETTLYFMDGKFHLGIAYIFLSISLSITAALLGFLIANKVLKQIFRTQKE